MASSSSRSVLGTHSSSSSTSLSTLNPDFTPTRILGVSLQGTGESIKSQTDPAYQYFWAQKLFNDASEFLHSGGSVPDYYEKLAEAQRYLKNATDGHFPPALAATALRHVDGLGVEKSKETALAFVKLAGYGSCPIADYLFGYFHEKGMLGSNGPDIAKALNTYQTSYFPSHRRKYALELIVNHLGLDLKNPDNKIITDYINALPAKIKEEPANSTFKLHYGLVLALGLANIESNTKESEKILSQLDLEANADARYFLLYLNPLFLEGVDEAMVELGKSGHVLAIKELAEKDETPDKFWIKKSAELGDYAALYDLAIDLIDTDFDAGLVLLRKVAEGNHSDAQFYLYQCYENGNPKEQKEAIVWLEKAAQNGCPEAQLTLGLLFAKGKKGFPKDIKSAEFWFKAGAQQGNVECQNELGSLHVVKMAFASKDADEKKLNMEVALKWYRKASLQGHEKATKSLATLYATLEHASEIVTGKSPKYKLKIRQELESLKPKPVGATLKTKRAPLKTEPETKLSQSEARKARREAKLKAEEEAKKAIEEKKAAEEKKAEELKKSLEEAKKILDEKIKAEEEQKAKAAEERRLKNKARDEERKKRRAEKAKKEAEQEETKLGESKQELKQESKQGGDQTGPAILGFTSLSSTPVKQGTSGVTASLGTVTAGLSASADPGKPTAPTPSSAPVQGYVALAYPPKPRSIVPLPTDPIKKKKFVQFFKEIQNLYAEFGSLCRKGLIDENRDEDKKLIGDINDLYKLFPGLYNEISTRKAIDNLTVKLKKFKAMEGKVATTVPKDQPKEERKEEAKVESKQVKEELKEESKEKGREESKETGRKERKVETKEESKLEKQEKHDTVSVDVSTEEDSFTRFPEIKLFLKNFDDLYQTLSSKIDGTKTSSFEDLILVRDSLGYLLTEFIKLILEHTHKNLLVDETVVWKLRNYLFHDAALSTPENLETDLSSEKLAAMQVENKRLWGLTSKLMSHVKKRIASSDKLPEELLEKESTLTMALEEFEGLNSPLLDTVSKIKRFDERECDKRSSQLEKEKMIYENAKKKIATETQSDKNAKLMLTYAQRFNEARLGTAVAKVYQDLGIPLCEYSRKVRTIGNERRHRLHRLFTLKVGKTKVSITSKSKPKKSTRTGKVSRLHRFFTFEGVKTVEHRTTKRRDKLIGKF